MKKIGIITFHRAHNYGAVLQAYALSKKLKELENDVKFIDYDDSKVYDTYKVVRFYNKNKKTMIRNLCHDVICFKYRNKRFKIFNNFIEKNYQMTKKCKNFEEVKKQMDNFDIMIAGSDQIWNPQIVGEISDIYTLNIKNENLKKISYAASIGENELIKEYAEEYKEKLKNLDEISVREEDAKKELEKILDKEVSVVLDPTLLLEQKSWQEEIDNCNVENEKYILAYVIKPDSEYVKIVNDLVEKKGLKVIHFGLKNPGYKNVLKSAYTAGPLEFVNYIKNAEYVVATSFHATVFSIIFNKKFFIIPHRKTGSRVTNLLEKLGISERAVNSLEEFEKLDYDKKIDYEKVNKKLDEERKRSIDWLNNAINS